MPTYEYECKDCGHVFERFESITAGSVKKCPECGNRAHRLLGAGSAIIFRGSGFYQTDYRSRDYHKRAKAEKGESTEKGGTAKKEKPQGKSSSTD